MVIKICGVTNADDAVFAAEHGASAIGLNFWPRSPRYISPEAAAAISRQAPAGVLKVGVFVNAEADEVARVSRTASLDVVQLHGSAAAPVGARVWRAVSVGEGFSVDELDGVEAEAILLDAPAGSEYGGTGQTFDWTRVAGARRQIVLAGGLDEHNVARAIETAKPWGVDACSRLESAPGKKDHGKVEAFLRAARRAANQ